MYMRAYPVIACLIIWNGYTHQLNENLYLKKLLLIFS